MDPGIDFSYFSSAPMPYTFFGLPPTPQSQTPRADDYKNFQNGNNNVSCAPSGGGPRSSSDADPTTSPISRSNKQVVTMSQEHFDPAFAAFQQNFHYDPTQFVPQPHSQHMGSGSPTLHNHRHSITSTPGDPLDPGADNDHSPHDASGLPRSSSEEKDNLTPQQNKRKAQNRAAYAYQSLSVPSLPHSTHNPPTRNVPTPHPAPVEPPNPNLHFHT